jgi:hypothetical protein
MRGLHQWNRWRTGGAAGLLLGALLLPLLSMENALPADQDAKKALNGDLARIPTDSLLVISCCLAEVWSGDIVKHVREKYKKEIDVAPQEFRKRFGLPLEQIERMSIVALDPPQSNGEALFFVHTVEAYDLAKILAAHQKIKATNYKDERIYTSSDNEWSIFPIDDRSLVFARLNEIRRLIDHPQPKTEGPLASTLRLAAGKHTLVCGVNVKTINEKVGAALPGELETFRALLQAQWANLAIDLRAKSRLEATMQFDTEKEAKAAAEAGQTGLTLLRAGLERGIKELDKGDETKSMVQILKQLQEPLKSTKIEQRDSTLRAAIAVEIDPAAMGLMFVETVQKLRESAARAQNANNLKQLALAMHNYHDTYGTFPPQAICDKNGKPLLSWRVAILPFIEQQNLYKQFRLDEPWDSEHNKKLLQITVKIYTSPLQDEKSIKDHLTFYQGFVGKGTFFEGKKGLRIQDFPDGLSNTLMIVEASKGVPWTKPEDISYDADKPLPKLGLPGSKIYQAALCDGAVRAVSPKVTEQTLRNAITRNDGNPLGQDW